MEANCSSRRDAVMARASERDDRVAQVADTMFALSTATRVRILLCLLDGPRTVGELLEVLDMEQSAVSHQLRVLREHTLVSVTNVGRRRVYSLYDEHVVTLLEAALEHVEGRAGTTKGSRRRGPARLAQ